MSLNKEDTNLKTLDEDYDMVPINTYIKAVNNYRMFNQGKIGYPNVSNYRNIDFKDDFAMKMMYEDIYSSDNSREIDYEDVVDVNKILMKIERYNPGIFQFLRRYGMSYEDAKKIITKIITVTLMYEND